MPGQPLWRKSKRTYIEAMDAALNPMSGQYGYEMTKYLWSTVYRLDQALNCIDGIDPVEVEWCIGNLEKKVTELRDWKDERDKIERLTNAIA